MGEISIKVSIANRVYPLKVRMEEEESVRKAVKLINEKIRDYEENFSVRDKQDLLAMCAIQLANEVVNSQNQANTAGTEITVQITSLHQLLNSYLETEDSVLSETEK